MRWQSTLTDKPKKSPSYGNGQFCKYHNDYGHDTDECHHLKDEIERLIRENRLTKRTAPYQGKGEREWENRAREQVPQPKYDRRQNELPPPPLVGPNDKPTIYMIMGGLTDGDSHRARQKSSDSLREPILEVQHVFEGTKVEFGVEDYGPIRQPHTDALIVKAEDVERIFVDTGSSVDVLFKKCFEQMRLNVRMEYVETSLFGFAGQAVRVMGKVEMLLVLGEGASRQARTVTYMVVDAPSQYNIILGRPSICAFEAVISIAHMR